MKIRVINTGLNNAYYNMGLDQALLESVQESGVPVLRLYGWNPSAVVVGYFQKLEEEVDIKKCKKMGIDFVRRMTGGGAVFNDKEIVYNFIVPDSVDFIRKPILESYEDLCKGMMTALKLMGIESEFAPLNDVISLGQKISGAAQTRKGGVILQHGTLILDLDVDKMFELLLVPDEKMKGKLIENIKERVTSVKLRAGRHVSYDEMAEYMIEGYKKAFPQLDFELSEVSPLEEEKAQKYADEKYSTDEWKFKF